MAKICFQKKAFKPTTLDLIDQCNVILERYRANGYDMSVRQIYYKLVTTGEIENTAKSYNKIQSLLSDGRLAGLIDWDYIVDRTRALRELPSWETAEAVLNSAHNGFRVDKWARQAYRPEIWIEKDALVGIFERVCRELQVPVLSCRGYTSLSEMFEAGYRRFNRYRNDGQMPIIFHFGDHDPSGIDMSRDIQDRLLLVTKPSLFGFHRLAFNMNQVLQYNSPPNPTKITDSRASDYIIKHGGSSWELDALEPDVLVDLVRENILEIRDEDLWQEALAEENIHKRILGKVVGNYDEIERFLDDLDDKES
jgi:hypothetical protein